MIPTLLQTSLISHQKDKNIGFCAAIPELFLRRVCVLITHSVDNQGTFKVLHKLTNDRQWLTDISASCVTDPH
jgi:hypothetical protein